MTTLKKQLKALKKDLGKPRFMDCISEKIPLFRLCSQLLLTILALTLSLVFWYNFYLDTEDYWVLFCALFFSVSWATLYDLYKAFVYRKFAFIGDRGIALLEVKRKNEMVTKITIELFNAIDKVIIDTERHYAVGHGGEWVEYIRIKNGRKTFLKIDANHSENYDEFKKTLSKYYQIFKVCREASG